MKITQVSPFLHVLHSADWLGLAVIVIGPEARPLETHSLPAGAVRELLTATVLRGEAKS